MQLIEGISRLRPVAMFVAVWLACGSPGNCREQWQMQEPSGPPPTAPIMAGGAPPPTYGLVPTMGKEFWRGQLNNRIPVGTVLTGILEQDLSSKTSKANDVFTILLQDGVTVNGAQVVPPQSKILGSVVSATPASKLGAGQHGQLQIALHQLITPDGRSFPIYAFIAKNPNLDPKKPPGVNQPGTQLNETPKMVSSFFGSFTAGVGSRLKVRHMGKDFHLEQGEVIPIRLNRSLDCTAIVTGQPANQALPPGAVPGVANASRPFGLPPQQLGAATPATAAPGLIGTGGPGGQNPNSIFNNPVNARPMVDIPDPF